MGQTHRVTMFRSTLLLCTIAVQVLSAPNPNPCWESYAAYQSRQIPETVAQQETAGSNNLGRLPLFSTRSGNWMEHGDYSTDDGAGRFAEEEGQIFTGPGRVQHYQTKHSSSSHGVNTDNARSPIFGDVAESTLASQSTIGSANGLESIGHRSADDEKHHRRFQLSTYRANNPQVRRRRQSPTASNDGNWHTSNSWKTDDGRGVVHEEQGQVVDGSAQMQYYRKNYSSNYIPGNAANGGVSLIQHSFEMKVFRSTVGGKIHGKSDVDEDCLPASGNESTDEQHRVPSHDEVVVTPSSYLFTDDSQHTSGNPGSNQQQRSNQRHSGYREPDQHMQNPENHTPQTNGFGNYPQETSDNGQNGQEKQQPRMPEFGREAITSTTRKPVNTEGNGEKLRMPAIKPTRKHTRRLPHSNIKSSDTEISQINYSASDVKPNLNSHSVNHSQNTEKIPQENLTSLESLKEQEKTNQGRRGSTVQGKDDSEQKLNAPRIEAYGGSGAYNAVHKEDSLRNANINPSATLAPNPHRSDDSWDVAVQSVKKSTKRPVDTSVQELDSPTTTFSTVVQVETTTPRLQEETTTPRLSFWRRIGNKINDIISDTKDTLKKL